MIGYIYVQDIHPLERTLNDPEWLFRVKFWLPCECEIIHALLANRVGERGRPIYLYRARFV